MNVLSDSQLNDEIRNFIEYAYSDDADRQRMLDVLDEYMQEVVAPQEPRVALGTMVFTFGVRKGEDIFWKKAVGDISPTSEYFPAEELHLWVAKYRRYGWDVKVN